MSLRSSTARLRERSRVTGGAVAHQSARELSIAEVRAPDRVFAGARFTVDMTARCGSPFGCIVEEATISAGGEEFASRFVAIGSEGEETLQASIVFDEPGTRTIQFRLGGQAAFRDVEVVSEEPEPEPPNPVVRAIDVSPDVPLVDERATIAVTVENTGGQRISPRYDVTVDGDVVGRLDFGLGPGAEQTRELGWTPRAAGTRRIEVAGASHLTVVEAPPEPEPANPVVREIAVTPGQPTAGEPAEIAVTVENTGGQRVSPRFDVRVDGDSVGSLDFGLGPGGEQTRRLPWTPGAAGTREIAVGDLTHLVIVEEAAAPAPAPEEPAPVPGQAEVREIAVTPAQPAPGTEATIAVTVENVGEQLVQPRLDVAVDGEVVGSLDFGIGPGAEQTRRLSWTPQTAGTKEVAVGDLTHLVIVEAGGPPAPGEPTPTPEPQFPGGFVPVAAAAALLVVLVAR